MKRISYRYTYSDGHCYECFGQSNYEIKAMEKIHGRLIRIEFWSAAKQGWEKMSDGKGNA